MFSLGSSSRSALYSLFKFRLHFAIFAVVYNVVALLGKLPGYLGNLYDAFDRVLLRLNLSTLIVSVKGKMI